MVEFKRGPSNLLTSKPGHPEFDPRWPNGKAIKIGWLYGRGSSSGVIAKILADGTTEEAIRTQLQRAELERAGENRNMFYIPVKLTAYERIQINKRAQERGIDISEWIRRVTVAAGVADDLYRAIVED